MDSVVVLVVMALVRVENVTVLGVLYLSVCLVVKNYSGSGIGGDGGDGGGCLVLVVMVA